MSEAVDIAPATGRLGVLLPGLGAVSTTFIAGVLALRKRLAQPIGSLTQLGTVRLGKRSHGHACLWCASCRRQPHRYPLPEGSRQPF